MGGAPSEVTQTRQIDKRAITAVMNAILYTKEPTLLTQYSVVKSTLALMLVDDYDKYKKVDEELYNALVNRRLKYMYLIYKDDDYNVFDLILISPIELNNEQLANISEKAGPYGSILRDSYLRLAEHAELDLALERTISGLVTKWAGKDSVADAVLDAVTALAREYNLDAKDVKYFYDIFCLKYGVCKEGGQGE
jgi:Zn-dependent M32 family carboxypeptidase